MSTMYTVSKSDNMTDEAFDRDLRSMVKARPTGVSEMPPGRLAKLKQVFQSMDADGDGTVDWREYQAATSHPTLLKLFQLMDSEASGGNCDGALALDEWLSVMSKVRLEHARARACLSLTKASPPPPSAPSPRTHTVHKLTARLSVHAHVHARTQVGKTMSDEEFEADLLSMIQKPPEGGGTA
jgi:hypothetical protein